MSASMIQAILNGRKTQTRRVVRFPKNWETQGILHADLKLSGFWNPSDSWYYGDDKLSQNYQPGDRLWVKETWYAGKEYDQLSPSKFPRKAQGNFGYLASRTKPEWAGRTRSARFMPRWASRITLEIVKVKVERLQEISAYDAIAEGVVYDKFGPSLAFMQIWDRINAKRGFPWRSNPWVWVIEFRMLEPAEASSPGGQ